MAQASAEKLQDTGPAEKERVASVPQRERAVGKNARVPSPKGKERSRLSKAPDHKRERVKLGESRTLARELGIRAKAWSGKGGLHGERWQIPRRTGRASKKSLLRTSRRKHERVSGRKSSPGRSAEF